MSIHVLSYNIHWGLSAFRRVNVAGSLSEFIHSSQADIILFQELWLPKGELEYIIVETLREVWPHQVCVATAVLPEGEQGNGILSRHPILGWKNIDMSFTKRQERSFLHVRLWIEEEQKPVSVICTHFGLSAAERRYQSETLANYIAQEISSYEAMVLAGDFNDWNGKLTPYLQKRLGLREVFQALTGQHAKSFPAVFPLLSLDRMYVRGLKIEGGEVMRRADWRGSSDHLPLAARLSF